MNPHHRALTLATARLDFPLPAAEEHEAEEHVAACDPCRIAVRRMVADARALRGLPAPMPPARVTVAITDAVSRALVRQRQAALTDTFHPLLILAALALLTAALVGAAVAGASAIQEQESHRELSVVPSPAIAQLVPSPSAIAAIVVPTRAPVADPTPTPGTLTAADPRSAVGPRTTEGGLTSGPSTTSASALPSRAPVKPPPPRTDAPAGTPLPTTIPTPAPTDEPIPSIDPAGPPTDDPAPTDGPVPTPTPPPNGLPGPGPTPPPVPGPSLGDWTLHRPQPSDWDSPSAVPAAVVRLGSGVLAIGNDGCRGPAAACRIVTWSSPDGVTWSRQPTDGTPAGRVVRAVAAGSGVVLLVDRADLTTEVAAILVSTDGRAWHETWSGHAHPQQLTVTATGLAAMLLETTPEGTAPVVVRSRDGGGSWRAVPRDASFTPEPYSSDRASAPIHAGIRDLAAGGRTIVAVGAACPGSTACVPLVWQSTNGRSWTRVADTHLAVAGADAELTHIVYRGTGWTAFGRACTSGGSCRIIAFRSADGLRWRAVVLPAPHGSEAVTVVRVVGSLVVAVVERRDGAHPAHAWASGDGRNWWDAGAIDPDGHIVRVRDLTLLGDNVVAAGRMAGAGAVFLESPIELP